MAEPIHPVEADPPIPAVSFTAERAIEDGMNEVIQRYIGRSISPQVFQELLVDLSCEIAGRSNLHPNDVIDVIRIGDGPVVEVDWARLLAKVNGWAEPDRLSQALEYAGTAVAGSAVDQDGRRRRGPCSICAAEAGISCDLVVHNGIRLRHDVQELLTILHGVLRRKARLEIHSSGSGGDHRASGWVAGERAGTGPVPVYRRTVTAFFEAYAGQVRVADRGVETDMQTAPMVDDIMRAIGDGFTELDEETCERASLFWAERASRARKKALGR